MHAPLANNNNQLQIDIKIAEPKPFNDNTMQACAWLSTLKRCFIAVGLTYIATEAANTQAACHYAVGLMAGNASR